MRQILKFDITADDNITFEYESYDRDGNDLDNIDLWWSLINTSDQSQTNITSELVQNGLIWEATTPVIGRFHITLVMIEVIFSHIHLIFMLTTEYQCL